MESRVTYQQKKRRKKKLRFRKWVIVVFLLFFLGIFTFSAYKIYAWYSDNKKVDNLSDDVLKNTKVKEKKDNDNTENVNPPEDTSNDYWDYIKINLLEVDFNELLKKNPDTVGWIEVKGTNINYPIVQTTDNSYYLTHAFDKTKMKQDGFLWTIEMILLTLIKILFFMPIVD